MVPHINSNGSITEPSKGMKPWLIAVIAVSSVLVLIIIIFVIWKVRKNRLNKKDEFQDIGGTNASLIHGTRV